MKIVIPLLYLLLTLISIVAGMARRRGKGREGEAETPTLPPEETEAEPVEPEKVEAEEIEEAPETVEESTEPPGEAAEEERPAPPRRPIRIAGIELTPKTMVQAIIIGEVLRRKFE